MTREHIFFIPILFFLGAVVGGLVMRWQLAQPRQLDLASPARAVRVSGRSLALLLASFLALFVATHVLSVHGGPRALAKVLHGQALFDQRPSFSADEVYARMAAFGAAGRAAYQRLTFTADLVFPLVLCTCLLQLMRYVTERVTALSAATRRALLALPVTWFLTDLAENAVIYYLLGGFPARHDTLAARLGTLTDLKFSLLLACIASAALLGARMDPHAARPPGSGSPAPG